jgi:hypothetical protein
MGSDRKNGRPGWEDRGYRELERASVENEEEEEDGRETLEKEVEVND